MERSQLLLTFVLLSVAAASGQHFESRNSAPPPDACKAIDLVNGPYQCPNGSSCGTYNTFTTEECNVEQSCIFFTSALYCCDRYPISVPTDGCFFTEMKDPRVRSRLLAMAEENDILVPTCSGAYVPARIAFREQREKQHGGS